MGFLGLYNSFFASSVLFRPSGGPVREPQGQPRDGGFWWVLGMCHDPFGPHPQSPQGPERLSVECGRHAAAPRFVMGMKEMRILRDTWGFNVTQCWPTSFAFSKLGLFGETFFRRCFLRNFHEIMVPVTQCVLFRVRVGGGSNSNRCSVEAQSADSTKVYIDIIFRFSTCFLEYQVLHMDFDVQNFQCLVHLGCAS